MRKSTSNQLHKVNCDFSMNAETYYKSREQVFALSLSPPPYIVLKVLKVFLEVAGARQKFCLVSG